MCLALYEEWKISLFNRHRALFSPRKSPLSSFRTVQRVMIKITKDIDSAVRPHEIS